MENIFSTLYRYKPQPGMTPEENFFTESLKIVLSSDSELLNKFVNYIGGKKVFKPPFVLDSQVMYGNSIIDLQITDRNYKKIFIEIKVNAHENRYYDDTTEDDFGQVEKYLRLNKGSVCFITKDQGNIQVKSNIDKFLGQFEWFEIYNLLDDYLHNKLNKTNKYFITNFLKFMKELDMQPFQGFSQKDIEISKTNFLDFENKLLDFIKKVYKDKKIQAFCKKHKLSAAVKTPKFLWDAFRLILIRNDWVYWKKRISLGFYSFTPDENQKDKEGIYYFQSVEFWPRKYEERFINDLKPIKVNSKYFIKDLSRTDPLYSEIYFPEFIKKSEKQIIDHIYKSLLELERSGVMDVLKKVR